MQSSSPVARHLTLGLCAVLLIGIAGPAAARESARIKRIKRTLVGIEDVLARAEKEREPLGPRTWTMQRRAQALQRTIRAGRSGGPAPRLRVFLELLELETSRRAAMVRMNELDVLMDALEDKRAAVIDQLQIAVQEAVASREVRQAVARWSNEGTLITYSADWEAVAMCESSGRWKIDSRFDGGLQFDPPTWIGFGGAEFARHAYQATKKQQITIAERVLAIQGPKAWPNCFRPLSTL